MRAPFGKYPPLSLAIDDASVNAPKIMHNLSRAGGTGTLAERKKHMRTAIELARNLTDKLRIVYVLLGWNKPGDELVTPAVRPRLHVGVLVAVTRDGHEVQPDDEAVIFLEGDETSEIRLRCPNAPHLAQEIAELVNARHDVAEAAA